MKIIEKLKDGYIPYKVYEDVELQFKNFVKSVRVLPADFSHEPNEYFTLKAMYNPGEKKHFQMVDLKCITEMVVVYIVMT